ncbi:MAG TPA: WecB/TagA/CpsF family glycosyltransferase [Methylotenera sp.]|nr:WecB/TagA/CpsF family glycosyltransferase [Methylotenera sp.]
MLDKTSILVAEFPVRETSKDILATEILQRMATHKKSILFFANTNFIVQCRPWLKEMHNEDVIIVNDGVGMDIAAYLLHKKKFKSNLNGTDFTPYFFSQSKQPLRVFLLGGKSTVLDKAAQHLARELGQIVVGSCDGYDGVKNPNLIQQINESAADVVLVAMGNPMQEQWVLKHYQVLDAKLVSGVGALFDFWAGDKPRAPTWIQKIRMEWFYRLCLEPKRLLKRYTLDILVFLVFCFKYRKQSV